MNTIYENLESQLCPYFSSYFICLITKISRILKIFQHKLFVEILKNKVRHDSTNICKLIYKGVSKDLQVCKVNATSQVGCQLTFAKNLCKFTKIVYFCNKPLYPPYDECLPFRNKIFFHEIDTNMCDKNSSICKMLVYANFERLDNFYQILTEFVNLQAFSHKFVQFALCKSWFCVKYKLAKEITSNWRLAKQNLLAKFLRSFAKC